MDQKITIEIALPVEEFGVISEKELRQFESLLQTGMNQLIKKIILDELQTDEDMVNYGLDMGNFIDLALRAEQ